MNTNTYQLSLNFEQILELVKQLPDSDKLRLSEELEKNTEDWYNFSLQGLDKAYRENEPEYIIDHIKELNLDYSNPI